MYQSHLKSNANRAQQSTIGQIRERQIKEGSLWSKSYENIHSNINFLPPSSSSTTTTTLLPLKPSLNTPDHSSIIIALQLEVDRLKAKVNTVIKTSEETINEFTLQHENIKNQYIKEYEILKDNYNDVIVDRDNLRQNMNNSISPMKSSSPLKNDIKQQEIETNNIDNSLVYINEKKELESKISIANDKIKELNDKLINLQNVTIDSNKIKQENDELNEHIKEITSSYEESHKICMKLEQELLSLSYAEKELKELKNEQKILEENIKELKNENFDYQNEIEKLMKLKEINTNISNKSSALSEKMSLLLDQYETEKNKSKCLDSEITKIKYDNDVLSTLLSAMEERNANLDKQLENSSKCISDLTNNNNLKDSEISNLREQCKVLHTKNKNANNRVETLESSLKELSDEFRALTEKDCKMFHSTLKEYESRLESSIVEKDTLISNINQLTKEKDEALALQSALSQLTEEMELKINQLEHDKRVLSDANSNTCALNDELQKTTTDFLTVATSTIKELEEKLNLAEVENERLMVIVNTMNNTETNHDKINTIDNLNDNEKDNSKNEINTSNNEISTSVNVIDNNIDNEKNASNNDISTSDNVNDNQNCNQVIDEIQIIDTPFNATKIESTNGYNFIQCITAMDNYNNFSQEELRFASLNKH